MTPRTEAGRALLHSWDVGDPNYGEMQAGILAIEAEAAGADVAARLTAALVGDAGTLAAALREWWGRVIATVPKKYRPAFNEQFRAALTDATGEAGETTDG